MRCEMVGPNARGRRRERGKGFLSRHQLREGLGLPTLAAAGFVTSGLQRESAMASRKLARISGVKSLEISRRVGVGGELWIFQYCGSLGTRIVSKKGGGREL